jgi:hypothetical protein
MEINYTDWPIDVLEYAPDFAGKQQDKQTFYKRWFKMIIFTIYCRHAGLPAIHSSSAYHSGRAI